MRSGELSNKQRKVLCDSDEPPGKFGRAGVRGQEPRCGLGIGIVSEVGFRDVWR